MKSGADNVAHHISAKKRIRQTAKRTERNKSLKSELRTLIKSLRTAISEKNKELATTTLKKIQSTLRNLAKRGVIKLGQASNKTSRLTKQVNSL